SGERHWRSRRGSWAGGGRRSTSRRSHGRRREARPRSGSGWLPGPEDDVVPEEARGERDEPPGDVLDPRVLESAEQAQEVGRAEHAQVRRVVREFRRAADKEAQPAL